MNTPKLLYTTMLLCVLLSCQTEIESVLPTENDKSLRLPAVLSVTRTVYEKPTGLKEAKRLAQSIPASDFETTGLYAKPNTALTVEVKQLKGTRLPVLLVGTYSRYSTRWNPGVYELKVGTNTITDIDGGILYIRYRTDAVENSSAEVKFVNGHSITPHYVLGKTTQTQWLKMLDTTTVPDVILEGSRAVIVASVAKARLYKAENVTQVIKTADNIINVEDKISGLDGTTALNKINVHKYLMTETDNAGTYMAATHYRTFFHADVANSILTVAGLKGWGPWHELGHMHQQSKWTWSSLGEVTVNIYSLAVERNYGMASRLKRDGTWAKAKIFLALSDTDRDFNGSNASVWIRLCMFQQLWLMYKDSFFIQLHKETRANTQIISTDAQKMAFFMKTACKISKNDLSEFFKKWGFKVDNSVYVEIAAMKLAKPQRDLTLLTD